MGCVSSKSKSKSKRKPMIEHPILLSTHSESLNNGKLIRQFQGLNNAVADFCDTTIPPQTPASRALEDADTPHSEFLTLVNQCLYFRIFSPFHPCLFQDESDRLSRLYELKYQRENPIEVARASREQYIDIDKKTTRWDEVVEGIVQEIESSFCVLCYASELPPGLRKDLLQVIYLARRWNDLVKGGVVDHLYQVFCPELHQRFDQNTCFSYYPHSEHGTLTVGAVTSLGLRISDLKAAPGSVMHTVENGGKAGVMLNSSRRASAAPSSNRVLAQRIGETSQLRRRD